MSNPSPEVQRIIDKVLEAGLVNINILKNFIPAQLIGIGGMTLEEALSLSLYLNPPEQSAPAIAPHSSRLDRMTRLAGAISTELPFEFDLATYHEFIEFYIGKASDGATADIWTWKKLQEGAGRGIRNSALSKATVLYKEQKPKAGQLALPDGETLYIVPEDIRVSFWQELDQMLKDSGFYTLIFQLSLRHRAKTTGAQTSAERTYTPQQLGEKHRSFLTRVTRLLSDREKTVIAQRVLMEQDFVLSVMEEDSFLRNVTASLSGNPSFALLMSLPEMALQKTVMNLSKKITEALLALSNYEPELPYEDQMDQYGPYADALYTAMYELAVQASMQYDLVFDEKGGIAAIVQVLESTLSRRSSFHSGSAQSGGSTPPQPQFDIRGELDRELNRELRGVLATLYADKDGAERIVKDSGLDKSRVALSGKALDNVSALLTEAAKNNKIGAVIEVALEEYPDNPKLQAFVNKLPKT